MKSSTATLVAVFASSFVAFAGSTPATAGPIVSLDVPTSDFDVPSLVPVVTSRYRLSRAGSVDQLLFKQPNPAGYPSADILEFNGGFTGSATYDFTVVHERATATAGGEFTFSLTNGTVTGNVGFRGAGANSTLSYTFALVNGSSELDYNILHVFAQATTSTSSISWSDLTFTPGTGLGTAGAMDPAGSITASNTYDQWLAAPTGVNLDEFDWTFSGKVTLATDGTNPSSGEGIKFEFTGKRGEFHPTVVPEPGTLVLALLAVGLVAATRRRGCRRVAPPVRSVVNGPGG